jgi:hypothetical protein
MNMNENDRYLRDLYAGLAMLGMMRAAVEERWAPTDLAVSAYDVARAMMQERTRQGDCDANDN